MKNEVILWPLTSSKIIVLVAQPILTDGGPPAWAVDKRAELGWPSSRGKGWPAVCKSGPRLSSLTVAPSIAYYKTIQSGTQLHKNWGWCVRELILLLMVCQISDNVLLTKKHISIIAVIKQAFKHLFSKAIQGNVCLQDGTFIAKLS